MFCALSEQFKPVYSTKHAHLPPCTHLPWPEHVLNMSHDTEVSPKLNVPFGLAHGTHVVVFCDVSEQLAPVYWSKHLHDPSRTHLPCPEHVVYMLHITESWPYVPLGSAHGVVVLSALPEQSAPVYWSKHRHAPSLVHLPCPEHVVNISHDRETPPWMYVPLELAHGIVILSALSEQYAPV